MTTIGYVTNVETMKRITQILGAIILTARVFAATETHTVQALQHTSPSTNTVEFPKFDTANGTLVSAVLNIGLKNTSSVKLESQDTDEERSVITTASVTFTITGISTNLIQSKWTNNFTVFDGVVDYAGTSGAINTNGSEPVSLSVPLLTSSVTGPGSFLIPVQTKGSASYANFGSGTVTFSVRSEEFYEVIYTYLPKCSDDDVYERKDRKSSKR